MRLLEVLATRSMLLALLLLAPASAAAFDSTVGFGVMGDSTSDEYRADDNRGGAYAATAFNWLELLARYRNLNFGPWGTRSLPRRTGYEYNWARSGATSFDLISEGQHTGLAEQVAQGKVSKAMLMIGANDFATWSNAYSDVYNGLLSGQALTAKINAVANNIRTAADTVRRAGTAELMICTVPDRGLSPVTISRYPDPARRRRVTDAVNAINGQVREYASQNGIELFDINTFGTSLLGSVDANGTLGVGGERIDLLVTGDEPHHSILADNEHAGTVMSGLTANAWIDVLNRSGLGITKFTDQEILYNAGIDAPPVDTAAPSVMLTAPTPGATVAGKVAVSANATDNIGVVGVQFNLDGANLGPELTSSPYIFAWDTTTSPNGSHTLGAVARDATGNQTTSPNVVVVVQNDLPQTARPRSPSLEPRRDYPQRRD